MTNAVAVLVAGGPLTPDAARRVAQEAKTAALLVGIDGGAAHLLGLGIIPHYVTGDFDSLSLVEQKTLAAQGARIVPTPDQDYTDLDKALTFALQTLGAKTVRVHGATSGRIDHTYSALSALIKHSKSGASVRLVDEWGETIVVPPGSRITLTGDDLPGRILSLITLGRVDGITTTGVRWPLNGEPLDPGVRDGTLNIVTETCVTVSAESGDLLLMLGFAAR